MQKHNVLLGDYSYLDYFEEYAGADLLLSQQLARVRDHIMREVFGTTNIWGTDDDWEYLE